MPGKDIIMNAHNPIPPHDPQFWSECERNHFMDYTESEFRINSEIRILSPRAGRWVAEVLYSTNGVEKIMADISTDSIYAIADDLTALWDRGLHQYRSTQQMKAGKA